MTEAKQAVPESDVNELMYNTYKALRDIPGYGVTFDHQGSKNRGRVTIQMRFDYKYYAELINGKSVSVSLIKSTDGSTGSVRLSDWRLPNGATPAVFSPTIFHKMIQSVDEKLEQIELHRKLDKIMVTMDISDASGPGV